MTVAYGTAGTTPSAATATITGTTSVTPAAPASLADGDYVIIAVHNKPDTSTPTTPTDWTLIGTAAGGAGTSGNSTGASRVTLFGREKTSAWSSLPAVTITGGTASYAQAFRLTKTLGFWETPVATSGADGSDGTGYSVTMAANPGITSGDFLFVFGGCGDDGAAWSAETITATGLTVGTVTERTEPKTTQGGDIGGAIWTASPTAGTASAAPVVGATLSTSQSGPAILVRLRDTNTAPAQTVSPTAVTSGETFPSGGSATKNILVVHDDAGASADDTNLINFLTGKGHTVTTALETASLPNSGYDLVIVTESGSSSSAAITSIPTCSLPVMMFETTVNTARMSSSAMVTNGSGTTWDLQTHSLNTGYPDPLTVFTASASFYGVPQADLASGVTALALAPSTTHATAAIADAGATLTTGTAPARRAFMGLITTRLSGMVAGTDSGNWFNDVVVWVGGGGGSGGVTVTQGTSSTTVSPTAIASAESFGNPVITGAGATTVSPTSIASGETFPGGGGTVNPDLPVRISNDSVECESHSYVPTIIDSNGNLYRIMESQLASAAGFQNQPRALKSTDGGETWVEQDSNNRPGRDTGSIADLESGCLTYSPTDKAMTFTWERSYPAYSRFFTSDHATTPDTWEDNDREQIGSGTGSPQFMSHTTPQNQSYEWIFWQNSTTISYVSRPKGADTTESSTNTIDTSSSNPAAILDANNTSHILYRKGTNELHYKKITSGGTLDSSSTRVDTNNTSTTPIAHAFPQAYVNGGNTYVGCLFANGSNHLRFVLITNGTPGAEQTVNSAAVVADPGATGSQGIACSLAVDPTNGYFYAVWSDLTSDDVMYSERPWGGSWSTPTVLETPAFEPAWVYAKVNTYPSGLRVLSYNYVQEIDDDNSGAWYGELALGGGGTGGVTITQTAAACRPDSIGSAESFGVPVVTPQITSVPTAISSAEAFGTPVRTSTISVTSSGITSAEAFGTHTITAGATSVTPSGIASAEAIGAAVISAGGTNLFPTSIASAQAFGAVSITVGATTVSPTGITSLQAFGTLSVTRNITSTPNGIVTSETFGSLVIGLGTITVSPSGIVTGMTFGTVAITIGAITTVPPSIVTAEAFGSPTVTITGVLITVNPESITTAQAFGTPNAQFTGLAPSFTGWGIRIF